MMALAAAAGAFRGAFRTGAAPPYDERRQDVARRRCELVERTFAHGYETGGMRRTHLRGHFNITKRLLLHLGALNLGLVLRKNFGAGKPRQLFSALRDLSTAILASFARLLGLRTSQPHHLLSLHLFTPLGLLRS